MFFSLASCTEGVNNCVTCNTAKTACTTCATGYIVDTNGVCQGNLFVYTVLLPYPAITYITVLVHIPITRCGPFRAFNVQEICVFGDLHVVLKRQNVKTILLVQIIEAVAVSL